MRPILPSPRFSRLAIFLVSLLAIAGCSQGLPLAPADPALVTNPSASSETGPAATETAAIASPIPYWQAEINCYKVSQNPNHGASGRLLLRRDLPNNGLDYFLYDVESGEEINLGDTFDHSISPDGSRLAFWDFESESFAVVDAKGNKISEFTEPDRQYFLVKWLDNSNLVFDLLREPTAGDTFPITLLVLNIETMEKREWFPEDFPLFYDGYLNISWIPESGLIINPDLDTMVFPSTEEVNAAVLWDLEREAKITQVHLGIVGDTPQWSPTGEYFVVNTVPSITVEGVTYTNVADSLPYLGGLDLFLVNRSGAINRLTQFTVQEMATVADYNWSPDGQKISFYWRPLDRPQPVPGSLTVVDISTGSAVDYCMQGYSSWSPDGRYIAQALTNGVRFSEATIYILDVATSQAWPILDDVSLLGWMAPIQ